MTLILQENAFKLNNDIRQSSTPYVVLSPVRAVGSALIGARASTHTELIYFGSHLWAYCNIIYNSEPPTFTVNIYNSKHTTWSPERLIHFDVVKFKHFPCYCPFVRGTHRRPVDSPHKGQWRGALVFSYDFFDVRLNKGLSKQSRRRWFKTPSRSIWHQCNECNDAYIMTSLFFFQN